MSWCHDFNVTMPGFFGRRTQRLCMAVAMFLTTSLSMRAGEKDLIQVSAATNNPIPAIVAHTDFIPSTFLNSLNEVTNLDEIKAGANRGDLDAQVMLGGLFEFGSGGAPEDCVEAAKWYRKAAERNDVRAQILLGEMYDDGRGVPKDAAEAAGLFRRAARQGNPAAQFRLSAACGTGAGVPLNPLEAYKWINLLLVPAKPADFIHVQCISTWSRPFTMINSETIGPGEFASIKTPLGKLMVTCISVQSNQVQIQVNGETRIRTLKSGYANPCAELFSMALELRTMLETNLSRAQLAEAQRRSTLYLRGEGEPETGDAAWKVLKGAKGHATAFFITRDGYALTARHAVENATRVSLRTSGGTYPATVVKADQRNDLALLKVTGRFSALPLQSSSETRLGTGVFTVGFPNVLLQGLEPKLTRGEISSLAGIADNPRAFQISVPIQPGNSGGALVNMRGNVVGVVVERLNDLRTLSESGSLPQNVNYAVKSSCALVLLESMPVVSGRLEKPLSEEHRLEDVAKQAEAATAMVLAY